MKMMDEKELEHIRHWLVENVVRNPFIMFDDNVREASCPEPSEQDTIDLIEVIVYLYEELHKQVTGDSYEYMFHWGNKVGSWVNTYNSIEECREGDKE